MAGRPVPKVAVVLAILFVIACGAALVLFRSLDSAVRAAIEREGPKVTGTSVDVGRVRLQLREGRGEFRDLVIGNPGGFSGDALRMGEIVLDIDTAALGKGPLVVEEIRVRAPAVRLQLDSRGVSNLQRIRDHLQAYAPASAGASGPDLVVRRLVFEDATVQVDATALGGKQSEWTLPPVELAGLGDPGGIPAERLAKVALETLVREVTKKAATEELTGRLKHAAGESLGDKAADAIGNLLGGGK